MPIAFSIEEGKRYGPALLRAKQPRERLHYRKPHCSVKNTCQTRKVIPGGVSQRGGKKKGCSGVQLYGTFGQIYFYFFSSEVTKQIKDGETSV